MVKLLYIYFWMNIFKYSNFFIGAINENGEFREKFDREGRRFDFNLNLVEKLVGGG